MSELLALAILVVLVSWAPAALADRSREERVARLYQDYAELEHSRREVELRLEQVTAAWRAATNEWKTVEDAYRSAHLRYRNALTAREMQSRVLAEASETYARAAERWRQVQMLVVLNAALDIWQIQRLQSGGKTSLRDGCDGGQSTSEYRRQLTGEGKNVVGMHIDHIVPKALGGADHPLNYRVVTPLENLSWGADWGLAKCLSVGMVRCALAVAVSVACGSFSGGNVN